MVKFHRVNIQQHSDFWAIRRAGSPRRNPQDRRGRFARHATASARQAGSLQSSLSTLWRCLMSCVLLATALALSAGPSDGIDADLVLRGGTLHDGSGLAGRQGDLAIKGDRIVAVGSFRVAGTPRVLDVKGLVVSPGFIDLHSHSDFPLQEKATRANLSFLYQGVTTVVTGNCGFGPADVEGYFRSLEKGKIGSNVIHLVPHNTVRRQVMKNANRPPSPAELGRMEALVEKGMKEGAWGLATGLIYNPGTYASTEEII